MRTSESSRSLLTREMWPRSPRPAETTDERSRAPGELGVLGRLPGAEASLDGPAEPQARQLVPQRLSDHPALLALRNGPAQLVEQILG